MLRHSTIIWLLAGSWLFVPSATVADTRPHLIVLMDVSGSMGSTAGETGQTRLVVAQRAASAILSELDHVPGMDVMVSFYTWAGTLHAPRIEATSTAEVSGRRLAADLAGERFVSSGGTNTGLALQYLLEMYGLTCRPISIVVLTDDPPTDRVHFANQAEVAQQRGVSLMYVFTAHRNVNLAINYFAEHANAVPTDWIVYPSANPPDWHNFLLLSLLQAKPYNCIFG